MTEESVKTTKEGERMRSPSLDMNVCRLICGSRKNRREYPPQSGRPH